MRGASLLGPASEELAEAGVVGDFFAGFSGELLSEEETGDVAGDGVFMSSLGFSAAGDADGAGAAGAGAASGEPGFGGIVFLGSSCSTTTG